jgi:sulfatase maturation enzyme AslB (radical SAM superfamily)
MTGFRDPPSAGAEARKHRIAMARAMVGALDLPQPLPRFGLSLLDVETAGRAIDLVLGTEKIPFALARIEPATKEESAPFEVSIRETQPFAVRYRAATGLIRERLARAMTGEKWREARAHADALGALPIGVPLSHFRQLIEGIEPLAGLVRTGFGCNQDCGFCWQSREWPGYDKAQVRAWIEDLHALGARGLTISGGEPTLDRGLVDHVRRAQELGMSSIVIETNAIQLGKRPALAAELRDAGLTRAFVSLHSADAATSDAATRAPGTHARTVAGIRALLDAKVHVILNAVIVRDTVAQLPDLPGFVRRTFGRSGWLGGISVSVPVLPWEHTLAPQILAEPEDVRASLARTIDAAEAEGVLLFGIDGPCGPPLCAFGADRRVTDLAPKAPISFRTHVAECQGCRVRGSCHGVQPDDYARFGARAVAPLF